MTSERRSKSGPGNKATRDAVVGTGIESSSFEEIHGLWTNGEKEAALRRPHVDCDLADQRTRKSPQAGSPVPKAPATITVPDDLPTIGEGINAAAPQDTVRAKGGVYEESLTYKGGPSHW